MASLECFGEEVAEVAIIVLCPLIVVAYVVAKIVGDGLGKGSPSPQRPEFFKCFSGYITFGKPDPIGTVKIPDLLTVSFVQESTSRTVVPCSRL